MCSINIILCIFDTRTHEEETKQNNISDYFWYANWDWEENAVRLESHPVQLCGSGNETKQKRLKRRCMCTHIENYLMQFSKSEKIFLAYLI